MSKQAAEHEKFLILKSKIPIISRIFWWAYFRGSLFSQGVIIGGNFTFQNSQNGLDLTIKKGLKHEDNSLQLLKTANLNSPWFYIREGLLLEGDLRPRLGGGGGGAYFRDSLFLEGLIIGIFMVRY